MQDKAYAIGLELEERTIDRNRQGSEVVVSSVCCTADSEPWHHVSLSAKTTTITSVTTVHFTPGVKDGLMFT